MSAFAQALGVGNFQNVKISFDTRNEQKAKEPNKEEQNPFDGGKVHIPKAKGSIQ